MPNRNLAGRRVLVVEDGFLVAMALEDMLGDAGAEVIGPAASVGQAIEALGRLPAAASSIARRRCRGGSCPASSTASRASRRRIGCSKSSCRLHDSMAAA